MMMKMTKTKMMMIATQLVLKKDQYMKKTMQGAATVLWLHMLLNKLEFPTKTRMRKI